MNEWLRGAADSPLVIYDTAFSVGAQGEKSLQGDRTVRMCYDFLKDSLPGGALDLVHLKVPFRERLSPLTQLSGAL